MSGAIKHMERSHRSHKTLKPFGDFERKAYVKKAKVENKSFLEKLTGAFHRTTNK